MFYCFSCAEDRQIIQCASRRYLFFCQIFLLFFKDQKRRTLGINGGEFIKSFLSSARCWLIGHRSVSLRGENDDPECGCFWLNWTWAIKQFKVAKENCRGKSLMPDNWHFMLQKHMRILAKGAGADHRQILALLLHLCSGRMPQEEHDLLRLRRKSLCPTNRIFIMLLHESSEKKFSPIRILNHLLLPG